MDGFYPIVAADPLRMFMYYAESQNPIYWAYARNFSLFDHSSRRCGPELAEPLRDHHIATAALMMSETDPNARDGCVGSMMNAFDFTQAPKPPLVLPPRTCP
jgi:hypothetical protein